MKIQVFNYIKQKTMKFYLLSQSRLPLKQAILLLVFVLCTNLYSLAEDVKYNDSWGNAGYTVESQNASKVVLNYSISEFTLSDIDIKGEPMRNISLPPISPSIAWSILAW